jgi:hypothetical protein
MPFKCSLAEPNHHFDTHLMFLEGIYGTVYRISLYHNLGTKFDTISEISGMVIGLGD